MPAVVSDLWRYAFKGLDRDSLESVDLQPGAGFPADRRWALHFEDAEPFDPQQPARLQGAHGAGAEQVSEGGRSRWLHKSNFLCAFTAPELLGELETCFEGAPDVLTVRRRSSGELLLRACLTAAADLARAEAFFSELHGRAVRVVQASGPHHFGNTPAGFAHDPSGCVIHLVNAATVASLSAAASLSSPPLHPARFRPNIVVSAAPEWSEFRWVGRRVRAGSAILEVLARTVRCPAVNVDARHGSGKADIDVPALLSRHYPQHGPYLGVYLRVVRGGVLRVGDTVAVEPAPWVLALAAAAAAAVLAGVEVLLASHDLDESLPPLTGGAIDNGTLLRSSTLLVLALLLHPLQRL